eukprot:TRINITY_DN4935_c1_g1_i2.p1 TRINITY_DN4935_c1_g1~~TRINITY_DN4935_c1_g1_i2.p1  ORF type:complete len:215 (+),score=22.39 TRINITY_DN4935_c1_g1_i2:96-740(+)
MTSSFNDDEVCLARLRVWKTFFELYAPAPKLRRCSSEPASCSVSEGAIELHNSSGLPTGRKRELAHSKVTAPLMCGKATAHVDAGSVELSEQLLPSDRTVVVGGIPCKVGHERMMVELRGLGLDGCYDFLYFPRSLRDRQCNRGFCFINFMSGDALTHFVAKFTNFQFEDIQSQKVACVGRAHIQGRQANVARLIAARTRRVEFKADAAGLRAP